jgi:indolepyruvate ferredoxin oxidoreductase beta subunit
MKYPPDLEEWVAANVKKAVFVDTSDMLKEVGTRKALNIVMLGILSNDLEFTEAQWEAALRSMVKEKFIDMNLKAFKLGREYKASA